ncbi:MULTISPECIES: NADH-quinone oxidoreductase subunit E [Stappiaceae]|jgi:NADH-quinone oxidoreductase subunit E|uniref:NADH-quinone oxidoreductase chain 2 n=1 Tax=Roseibium aggregatum TaxID=187304 RepID=A0A0M6XYY2_9HYPH|nr:MULTISPECIES: NADH-quinone oxidoreductase subunit E [Stappiaceae]MCR9282889.1 NADH-quinone oxidoreductase subunit E [Paracoccaceae bacterium]MEC9404192.1 NADH-quinone oxidoreductase subunit E [Pseudomonadota bacterium]ERP97841.1 NADH dehydrogenase subunit E [Labrenzia sp. C1B10]ERS01633.1 NADH dehydrogenase subunit E [Labrenzia sp. C1B70]MBO9462769.1 NADH-quinone oxidoreductase subunit E [Labrenzia sp. R5_0]
MAVRRLAAEQPESFAFTEKNLDWAKKLIDRYPAGRQASAVIPLLWRAQEQNEGWVSEPAIRYIADLLDMPKIRVLEVATFYTMFQLQPVGKKAHIQVCGTTPCQLRGSEDLIKICKSRIAKHMHEISEDGMFSWEEVECLGACVNAPMVQIFKDTYEDLTEDSFNQLIDDIAAGKEVTPGPQNGRRFAMAEGGQTSLTEIDDNTKGELPVPHLVDGSEKASHAFAGAPINAGGNDYDGVPTPAEDAVAKVKAAHAAKSAKASEAPAAAAPKKAEAKAEPAKKAKAEKAATPAARSQNKGKPDSDDRAEVEVARTADTSGSTDGQEKEPELLKEARGGKPDDLKKLKGVGPKLEATLNELGFFHFDQVASWGPQEVAWVDSRLKFKGRIERDGWIEQAKVLASGGETDFSKRVEAGEVASSKSED